MASKTKTPRPAQAPYIHVGSTPDAFATTCTRIVTILSIEKCGDGPKEEAMKALSKLHRMPHSLSITGNNFRGR